jgi:hypothetical protein
LNKTNQSSAAKWLEANAKNEQLVKGPTAEFIEKALEAIVEYKTFTTS